MKNLIILCLLALGLASCNNDDYQEVDSGIVVCANPVNNSIGLEHADSTFCFYSLKYLYDETTADKICNRKIAPPDTVYVLDKGDGFVASTANIRQSQKICDFIENESINQFYKGKGFFILSGILICLIVMKNIIIRRIIIGKILVEDIDNYAVWTMFLICWTLIGIFYCMTMDYGQGYKLIPECSGKITKIENNTVHLEGDQIFHVASEKDIMTGQLIKVEPEQTVYAYRYVSSNNNGYRIFLSSEKFSKQTLDTPVSYPPVFFKTYGFFVIILVVYYPIYRFWRHRTKKS